MNKFIDNISKFISSFFGLGFIPFAPGTFGSLAGVAIYYFLWRKELIFYAVLFFLIMIGFAAAGRAERACGKKDPGFIVIDEVVGSMIAFILVSVNLINIIIVFALFRIMDVTKPFPIKRIEDMPSGFGIMLDDVVAGFYANIIFYVVFSFASCRI